MGIYIKGMEMPKDDQKIRFVKLLNGKMYALKETRNGWPLSYLHKVIEVTEPHGRLIDEAEVRVIMHQVCARSRRTYEATECAIRNMKAVIEAEGE